MPLSDEEQRILRDIEANFHAQDPKFVRAVNKVDARLGRGASIKIPAIGFFVFLAVVIATYHSIWPVAVVGLAAMVLCAGIVTQAISQRSAQKARSLELIEDGIDKGVSGAQSFWNARRRSYEEGRRENGDHYQGFGDHFGKTKKNDDDDGDEPGSQDFRSWPKNPNN